jgi:hypothetical protein
MSSRALGRTVEILTAVLQGGQVTLFPADADLLRECQETLAEGSYFERLAQANKRVQEKTVPTEATVPSAPPDTGTVIALVPQQELVDIVLFALVAANADGELTAAGFGKPIGNPTAVLKWAVQLGLMEQISPPPGETAPAATAS